MWGATPAVQTTLNPSPLSKRTSSRRCAAKLAADQGSIAASSQQDDHASQGGSDISGSEAGGGAGAGDGGEDDLSADFRCVFSRHMTPSVACLYLHSGFADQARVSTQRRGSAGPHRQMGTSINDHPSCSVPSALPINDLRERLLCKLR